jgi:hypothetical protein
MPSVPSHDHGHVVRGGADAGKRTLNVSFSAADWALLMAAGKESEKPRIFIAFADSQPKEAKDIREWLSRYVKSRQVYSNTEKGGWNEFLEDVGAKFGIVLFHGNTPTYTELRKLASFLNGNALSCFKLSFKHQDNAPLSITRLFPRGLALCITESTMMKHPEETLSILRWWNWSITSRATAEWKLMLIPKATDWLQQRLSSDGERTAVFVELLEVTVGLETVSLRKGHEGPDDPNEIVRGFPTLEKDQVIMSPAQLSQYDSNSELSMTEDAIAARDKIMAQYFVGWAAVNATSYRRFHIIHDNMSHKTVPHACHVYFLDVKQFLKVHNVPAQQQQK